MRPPKRFSLQLEQYVILAEKVFGTGLINNDTRRSPTRPRQEVCKRTSGGGLLGG